MKYKIAAIWLAGWMITWPALLADVQAVEPNIHNEEYRQDIGVSMLLALFPPVWVAAPFMTGFYEHGFQFGRRP